MIVEKIKITREQEGEFKKYLRLECSTSDIESYISDYGTVLQKHYPNLYKVKPEQFALLLCGWYEVEEPFKVGDWVYDKGLGLYRKVAEESFMSDRYVFVNAVRNTPDTFEKIEESWKIMLLELGRDKPEFNPNDIIITGSEVYKADWLTDKDIINLYEKGVVKAFHAYENRIEVKDYDSN